jgi:hypothetical protein
MIRGNFNFSQKRVHAACLAAFLSMQAFAAPINNAAALGTNAATSFVVNSGTAGSLPSGLNYWYSINANAKIGYGSDADGSYVEIALSNPQAKTGRLPEDFKVVGGYQTAFGVAEALATTKNFYRFATKVKVLPGVDGQPVSPFLDVFVRYVTNDSDYFQNQAESVVDNHRLSAQSLLLDTHRGQKLPKSGVAVTSVTPVLMVDNLFPGESVRVRVYSASMNRYAVAKSVIYPLDATQKVKPGKVGKLSVKVASTGLPAGSYLADFKLVSSLGLATALNTVPVSVPASTSGSLSELNIPIQGALPSNLANGTYAVSVRLRSAGSTKGLQLAVADAAKVQQVSSSTAGYEYRVGSMVIDSVAGGIFTGTTAVNYPELKEVPANGTRTVVDPGFTSTSGATWGPKQLGLNAIRQTLGGLPWTTTTFGGTTPVFDPQTYTQIRAKAATLGYDWTYPDKVPFASNNLGVNRTFGQPQLTLSDWAGFFATSANNVPVKNLLFNTWGVPYEASSDPHNVDSNFAQGGIQAPVSANGLAAYKNYLAKLFSTYGNRMFAIECSNEPNSRGFWSGSQTQLADSCKAIHDARAAAKLTSIPIICPAVDVVEKAGYMLSAKTTGQRPITDYCDWIGAHSYVGVGNDSAGKPYSADSLAEVVRTLRYRMNQWGVGTKPIIFTEYGINGNRPAFGRTSLNELSDASKADTVYQSMATLSENGVAGVILYSIDTGENFIWTLNPAVSRQYNSTVMQRIQDAARDLGATRSPW